MAKRTRPVKGVQRRYAWRLYLTAEQATALLRQAHMCIDLWNALMEMWEVIDRRCTQRQAWERWRSPDGIEYNMSTRIDAPAKGDGADYPLARDNMLKSGWTLVSRSKGSSCHGGRATGWWMGDTGPETLQQRERSPVRSIRRNPIGSGDHRDARNRPNWMAMGEWITAMLKECPEWRALSTWTPRQVAVHLDAAYKAFFSRSKRGGKAGYPRYKSHRGDLAIPHRCVSGCRIVKSERHRTSWLVRLKGLPGDIHARGGTRHHGVGDMAAMINEWMDGDVRLVNGKWEISVAVDIDKRRNAIGHGVPATVRFGVVGGLALVNNDLVQLEGLMLAQRLDDHRDRMQSKFDECWPRGKRWSDEEWQERCEQKAEISRLAARIARIRRNALHVWSKQTVERHSMLIIIKLGIKEHTQSPRGNQKHWGAEVEPVSMLNRKVLFHAPAMAAAMLDYKAKELGIGCEIIEENAPEIAEGRDLVEATKSERRARHAVKQEQVTDGISSAIPRPPRNPGDEPRHHARRPRPEVGSEIRPTGAGRRKNDHRVPPGGSGGAAQ